MKINLHKSFFIIISIFTSNALLANNDISSSISYETNLLNCKVSGCIFNDSTFNHMHIDNADWLSSSGWQYRKKITIKPSKVANDFIDFSIYLDLKDLVDAFFAPIPNHEEDKRITKADGVKEPEEQNNTAYTFNWTGANSTDWNDNRNWSPIGIPNEFSDVNITPQSNILIINLDFSNPAVCNNLTIQSGASIIIPAGKALTVNGLLTNNAEKTGLIIQSDIGTTGSLIHNSTGVRSTFNYTLPGEKFAWHMISSPVSEMIIDGSQWAPNNHEDFYLWDEQLLGNWVNYRNTTQNPTFTSLNGSDYFSIGHGYLVDYQTTNPVKTFAGVLNAGNINISLANSSLKSLSWAGGWNLIGNPYSSSINFNTIGKTNLAEGYAQVYNPNKTGGEGYEQVTTIAPGQGFFVKAAFNGGSLQMNTSNQIHGAQLFKEAVNVTDRVVIRLSQGQFFDETFIYQNPGSQMDYDYCDASKLYSVNEKIPQICTTIEGGLQLCINSVPEISEYKMVPLIIKVPTDGILSIKLFSSQKVILEDKQANVFQELYNQNEYIFTSTPGEISDRFMLHFSQQGIEAIGIPKPQIFYSHGLLSINKIGEYDEVKVFDTMGREILKHNMKDLTSLNLPFNPEGGIYIVLLEGIIGQSVTRILIN